MSVNNTVVQFSRRSFGLENIITVGTDAYHLLRISNTKSHGFKNCQYRHIKVYFYDLTLTIVWSLSELLTCFILGKQA